MNYVIGICFAILAITLLLPGIFWGPRWMKYFNSAIATCCVVMACYDVAKLTFFAA